jgi:hypothetical protein
MRFPELERKSYFVVNEHLTELSLMSEEDFVRFQVGGFSLSATEVDIVSYIPDLIFNELITATSFLFIETLKQVSSTLCNHCEMLIYNQSFLL